MKLGIISGTDGNKKLLGTYETISDVPDVLKQYENSLPMTYEQLKKALMTSEEEIVENVAGTGFIGMVGIPERVVKTLLDMGISPNKDTEYNITLQK